MLIKSLNFSESSFVRNLHARGQSKGHQVEFSWQLNRTVVIIVGEENSYKNLVDTKDKNRSFDSKGKDYFRGFHKVFWGSCFSVWLNGRSAVGTGTEQVSPVDSDWEIGETEMRVDCPNSNTRFVNREKPLVYSWTRFKAWSWDIKAMMLFVLHSISIIYV